MDVDVMVYSLLVGAFTFVVGLLLGRPVIRVLRHYRVGKAIREEGPAGHQVKVGTLTMGGILIFAATFVSTILFNLVGRLSMLLPLTVVVTSGLIGALDDMLGLVGRNRGGLAGRVKLLLLTVLATGAALVLHFFLGYEKIHIPFVGSFSLGWAYIPIAIFVIVGTANAVNLTDGLDTLAGGIAAMAFAAYGIIAYLQGQSYLVTFCFSVVGAILAFLWYNAHPAELMMGDTGSLALGATLATVALMTGQWLLLPVVGFVFVAVAASVILQVAYFKLTGGKRLFRMAPIHHHFELMGWSEPQVTTRFWLVGICAAMVGVALALAVPPAA
jgi:phospho-N-acetylmuramoyl-pentapeptide-transferase